jgi:hypothetical protein
MTDPGDPSWSSKETKCARLRPKLVTVDPSPVITDLRSTLEADPAHRSNRFRYAVALADAGVRDEALRQLRVLRRILLMHETTELLEDGVTPVGELLEATHALEERLG